MSEQSQTVTELEQAMTGEHAKQAAADAAAMVGGALMEAAAAQAALEARGPDDALPLEKEFFSTGHACQMLQVSPSELRKLMKKAGVRFAMSINDVMYLNGFGVVAINQYRRGEGPALQGAAR